MSINKNQKHDIRQLQNDCMKQIAHQYMNEYLNTEEDFSNTEEELNELYSTPQDKLDKYLKPTRLKKKEYMTEEMLHMMEDGRTVNNNYIVTYSRVDEEYENLLEMQKMNG